MRILRSEWLPDAPVRGIITHWSAGRYDFSELDRQHYHFGIAGDGTADRGRHSIGDNCSPERLGSGSYAAHTRARNSYRVGIAVCCMAGAVNSRSRGWAGRYPLRPEQYEALVLACADLVRFYDLPVNERTLNSHFEQERVWGPDYWQRGKWDVSRLPWEPERPPEAVAEAFRARVRALVAAAEQLPCRLFLDGQDLTAAADPYLEQGSCAFWVRPLAEALDWRLRGIWRDQIAVVTPAGARIFLPVRIRGGRGFVTAREVAQALGWHVGWDPATRSVDLRTA
jgi:hypothetical protein